MSATLTTVNSMMKEVYEGEINDQLPGERVTIRRLERTADDVTDHVGGKYVVFPVRSGRNHGISYRGENEQLADAGQQAYKHCQETLRYGYQRVRITGQTMALAKTKPQAFANAMEREIDGAKDDVSKDENRIAWGHVNSGATVNTGLLANLTSSPAASATFTVDDDDWLEVGMKVDIRDSTDDSVDAANVTITAIAANTITVTPVVTATSGDSYVTRAGNYDKEPYGISNIVNNTGALHQVDPATGGEEFWASNVDAATTSLTELKMIQMVDNIRKAGGGKTSAIFCSLGVRRAYFNLLQSDRRFVDPKQFDGGLVGLSFMYGAKDIPVVEDPDAPVKNMAFLDESEIKIFRDKDWYWEDIDGAVFKWVSNYDAYEALLKQYWQMGTHKRNAHGRMTNITES